jgi:hypothetical protein
VRVGYDCACIAPEARARLAASSVQVYFMVFLRIYLFELRSTNAKAMTGFFKIPGYP